MLFLADQQVDQYPGGTASNNGAVYNHPEWWEDYAVQLGLFAGALANAYANSTIAGQRQCVFWRLNYITHANSSRGTADCANTSFGSISLTNLGCVGHMSGPGRWLAILNELAIQLLPQYFGLSILDPTNLTLANTQVKDPVHHDELFDILGDGLIASLCQSGCLN